jgi:hypothetical protein
MQPELVLEVAALLVLSGQELSFLAKGALRADFGRG